MHSRSRTPLRLILLALALLAAPSLAGQDSARSTPPAAAAPAATTPAVSPATATPASAAAAERAGARAKAAAARGDTTTRGSRKDDEFPQPLELALLLVALFGMLGAFAGDLVADEFSIASVRRNTEGWNLGFVGRWVVGAVAALVTVNVNPPEGWATLIGTAAAAGVAGEAILKSISAGRHLGVEQTRREMAEVKADKNGAAAENAEARYQIAKGHLHTIAGATLAGSGRVYSSAPADAGKAAAAAPGGSGGTPRTSPPSAPSASDLAEYALDALKELRQHAPSPPMER